MGEGGGRAGKTPGGGSSSPPLGKCAGIGLRLARLAWRVPRSGRPGGRERRCGTCKPGLPPSRIPPRRPVRGIAITLVDVPRIAGVEPVGWQATALGLAGRKPPICSANYSTTAVKLHAINPATMRCSTTGGLDPEAAGLAGLVGGWLDPTQASLPLGGGFRIHEPPVGM